MVKELEHINFGTCNIKTLDVVKNVVRIENSKDEYLKTGESLENSFFWPKVYRLTFINSTEEIENKFSEELKNCSDPAKVINSYFQLDKSYFESLMLVYKYLHLTKEEVENLDFWYFESLVLELKKLIKRDDDNRTSGQSLERD
jgi:hypothetical protein